MSKPDPPANFMAWKRAEVMAFFTGYDQLEKEEIQKIESLWLHGSVLPDLSVEALIQGGMPLGSALKIIRILQEANILSISGKVTLISYSNYTYLLTVTSSLKLPPLVSKTRISFSYLLTVLPSLKLLLLLVGGNHLVLYSFFQKDLISILDNHRHFAE